MSAISAALTLLGALIWFVLGYLGRQPDEAFDKEKVFKTIIAAIIVGIIVVAIGGTEQDALSYYQVLERIGAIAGLEQIWNVILNRILVPRRLKKAAEQTKTQ